VKRHRAIIIGTFNRAKAEEIRTLLAGCGLALRMLSEFPHVRPVPEEGATFAENAKQKALGLARQLAGKEVLGVLAEDSGLEVDALDGRPGVLSARYGGPTATDAERVERLLEELAGVPPERRTARFRCHAALADADNVLLEAEGVVEGRISLVPAGDFGFGYDPVFIPDAYDRTFAELGAAVKHRLSHRASAMLRLREGLAALAARTARR